MLIADDVATLRREAADALMELQQLPGFRERFEQLPRMPANLHHWSFPTVRRVSHDRKLNTVVWDWVRPSLTFPTDLDTATRRGRIATLDNGTEIVRVPSPEPLPTDEQLLSQIDDYRDAVINFAGRYAFGAEWSSRAVHDALRLGGPITLPSRPDTYVELPVGVNLQLSFQPREPVPAAELAELRGALQTIAAALDESRPHIGHRALETQRSEMRERARTSLEREAQRSPRHRGLLMQLMTYEQARPIQEAEPWLTGRHREAMWKSALEAVRVRLIGQPVSNSSRKGYERAKHYLNAAVNGERDARIPLEPTDAGDRYFTEIGPLLSEATRALTYGLPTTP